MRQYAPSSSMAVRRGRYRRRCSLLPNVSIAHETCGWCAAHGDHSSHQACACSPHAALGSLQNGASSSMACWNKAHADVADPAITAQSIRTMLWMVRYAVVETSPYASASKMTAASPRHSPDLNGHCTMHANRAWTCCTT